MSAQEATQRAIEAIRRGEIRVPLACGWCGSHSITQERLDKEGRHTGDIRDTGNYECVACGRVTPGVIARVNRRAKIKAKLAQLIEAP